MDLLRVLGVDKLNSGNMVVGGTGGQREKGNNRGGGGRGGGEEVAEKEVEVHKELWSCEMGGTVRGGDGGAGRGRGGQDSGSNTQEVTCQCSQPAARRIVQKEGNNQGREFYCCPRPREEQCGFFQWADEEVQGGGGGIGGGGGQVVNCNCCLPSARRTV